MVCKSAISMNSRNAIRVFDAVDMSAKGELGAGTGDSDDAGGDVASIDGVGNHAGIGIAEKLLGWAVSAGFCCFLAVVRFLAGDGMVMEVLESKINVGRL
jgi:hypothetical protein